MLLFYYRAIFRALTDYRRPKRKSYRISYNRSLATAEKEDLESYSKALLEEARHRQRRKNEDEFVIAKLLAGL